MLRRAGQYRVVPVEYRFDVEARPGHRVVGIVTHPFTERSLFENLTGNRFCFDSDLGIRRYRIAGIRSAHNINGLSAQAAREIEFADAVGQRACRQHEK